MPLHLQVFKVALSFSHGLLLTVQAAWKLGKRKCNIVVFDWLLDCTVNKHKSCRAAAGYTLDRTIKRIRKGKTDHAEYRRKFEEGVKESKDLCDNRKLSSSCNK